MTAAKIIRYGVAAANGGHRRSFDVMGVTIYVEPHEDDAHAERIAEELAASGAVVARMLEAESHAHRLAAENDRLKMQLKAAHAPTAAGAAPRSRVRALRHRWAALDDEPGRDGVGVVRPVHRQLGRALPPVRRRGGRGEAGRDRLVLGDRVEPRERRAPKRGRCGVTAYPVMCLVDQEDGYRTALTLEDGDAEAGSIGRMVIQFDRDVSTARIELSPEAARALVEQLTRLLQDAGEGGAG